MSYVFIKLIQVNSGYHCLDIFLMLEKIWPPVKKKTSSSRQNVQEKKCTESYLRTEVKI